MSKKVIFLHFAHLSKLVLYIQNQLSDSVLAVFMVVLCRLAVFMVVLKLTSYKKNENAQKKQFLYSFVL